MREARVDVPAVDRDESQLRVELARPVVCERLEEHHLRRPARLRQRVLDDGTPETAPTMLGQHLDVLDLRDASAGPQLAPTCDLAGDRRCEEPGRHRGGHLPLRLVQLRRDVVASPALAQDRFRAGGEEVIEAHFADHRRVDETVGLAGVGEHQMRSQRVAQACELVGEPRRCLLGDHPPVKAVGERAVGVGGESRRGDRRLFDRHVVVVVHLRRRVGEVRDPVRSLEDALGGSALEVSAEATDALDRHGTYLGRMAAVSVEHLLVVRGGVVVLDDLSFEIAAGTITGLLGPSGSGKSTLIRSLVGVQIVAGGRVDVLGAPAGSAPLRTRVAYVTQAPSVYADLTLHENLSYFARILGCDRGDVVARGETVGLGRESQPAGADVLRRAALARVPRDRTPRPAGAPRTRRADGRPRPGAAP